MLAALLLLLALFALLAVLYALVLTESQRFHVKYGSYACLVMLYAIVLQPLFFLRPRNAWNIRLAALLLNPLLRLYGHQYRLENGQVLKNDRPCIIVANHQSAIDFIGMMHVWPEYVQYCTILAKRELLFAGPFGLSSWLAGVEFIDRSNHERARDTLARLVKKIQKTALRVWIFPEGTRSMNDTFLPFKFGAFRLAINAQVPIVPVVFSSYKSIYASDKATKAYYWRPSCITIKCLEAIDTTGMTLERDLQRVTELTRQRMLDAYASIETTIPNDGKDK